MNIGKLFSWQTRRKPQNVVVFLLIDPLPGSETHFLSQAHESSLQPACLPQQKPQAKRAK